MRVVVDLSTTNSLCAQGTCPGLKRPCLQCAVMAAMGGSSCGGTGTVGPVQAAAHPGAGTTMLLRHRRRSPGGLHCHRDTKGS